MQQRMFKKAAIAIAVTALAACQDKPAGLNLTPPIPPPGAPIMYIINGATDSPNLSVALTDSAGANAGGTSTDLAFGGVLKTATHVSAAGGDATLAVDELLPSDVATSDTPTQPLLNSASTINAFDVTAQIVTNLNATAQVMTVTANGGATGYGLGQADIVVADAAPLSAAAFPNGVAYFFTDSDATHILFPAPPLNPFGISFGVTIDPYVLSGNDPASLAFTTYKYRMIVVDATNPANVLFDSGSASLLQPPSGGPMVLALIDNPSYSAAAGNSPFMLFNSMTGKVTSNQAPLGSVARFVNAANLGGLDVDVSNVTPAFTTISNVAQGSSATACGVGVSNTVLDPVNGVPTNVDFSPTGSGTPDAKLELAGFTFDNSDLQFFAAGDVAPTGKKTFVFANDARSVATEARLRFTNFARSTVDLTNNRFGNVLVYVNPTGTVSDAEIQAGTATPAGSIGYGVDPNSAKPFTDAEGTAQPYLEVAGGGASYDIRIATVNPDGTTETIVFETTTAIASGASLTEALVDGSPSPTLTTIDNTVAACGP